LTDVIIIGAGVTGSAAARYLSQYNVSILVLEKSSDAAAGTTKANSGIVHAGFDAKTGSLKAKYNVSGAAAFPSLSKELDFPFIKNGALVLAFSEEDVKEINSLYERGIKKRRQKPFDNRKRGNIIARTVRQSRGRLRPLRPRQRHNYSFRRCHRFGGKRRG